MSAVRRRPRQGDRPPAPRLDGDAVYLSVAGSRAASFDRGVLSLAILGDSLAAGIGAARPEQLPGVRLASGLAAEAGRPVRLITHAKSGTTTPELPAQVDRALLNPPDLAVVIIGANDVLARLSIGTSARILADQVARLIASGVSVVVATCPDLGIVRRIPQPLRTIVRLRSLMLDWAQHRQLSATEASVVSLAKRVSADFFARPADLFSGDAFHPNGVGYALATRELLPPLRVAVATRSNHRIAVNKPGIEAPAA